MAFGPRNLGMPEDEIQQRVKDTIEMVGLDYDAVAEKSPFELSGGQKRRVAIAGVLAMKPQVLILDEPTAGLDPKAHKDILTMIEKVHEIENNIIIFVSHNMEDVANLAHKVMVMDKGKLVAVGTPREVFAKGEQLAEIGLSVPPAAALLNDLKSKGVDVDDSHLYIDEVEEELYRILRK